MCRMLGYLGRARALSTLLDDPPHSLLVQSYKAKELEGAVVNADGWGAAWYAAEDPEPIVYRSTLPIWGDVNRTHIGRAARSTSLLAAVRRALRDRDVVIACSAPFLTFDAPARWPRRPSCGRSRRQPPCSGW